MTLEDKLAFQAALLGNRTREGWASHRPSHYQELYGETFQFEGCDISGLELARKYSLLFPSEVAYSDRAHLNRMLAECDVPMFRFGSPAVLQGFLLSAKSKPEWEQYEPSVHTFDPLQFQHQGVQLKGQMLLHNVRVEELNQERGTHYAFIDVLENPELRKGLYIDRHTDYLVGLFNRAGIETKHQYFTPELLNSLDIRTVLLSKKTEPDWVLWAGTAGDFYKMRFDLKGVRRFSGAALKRAYGELTGKKSLAGLFADACIEVGSSPELLRKGKEDHFEKFYGAFEDPVSVREMMLQVQDAEAWAKPHDSSLLRPRRIRIDERDVTLHTLMQMFCVYKMNQGVDTLEYATLADVQERRVAGVATSNSALLGELLDFAGIEYKFIPKVSEVPLRDPKLLRRLLFNGTYEDHPVAPRTIKTLPVSQFRATVFYDPQSGLKITGHSLMIFFSAYPFWQQHPTMSLEEAANGHKQGRSNKAVQQEILEMSSI